MDHAGFERRRSGLDGVGRRRRFALESPAASVSSRELVSLAVGPANDPPGSTWPPGSGASRAAMPADPSSLPARPVARPAAAFAACPHCGYDLRGVAGTRPPIGVRCPECGGHVSRAELDGGLPPPGPRVTWAWTLLAITPSLLIGMVAGVHDQLGDPRGLVSAVALLVLPVSVGALLVASVQAVRREPLGLWRVPLGLGVLVLLAIGNTVGMLLVGSIAAVTIALVSDMLG